MSVLLVLLVGALLGALLTLAGLAWWLTSDEQICKRIAERERRDSW
jgi:hypothetical protein